MAHPIVLDFTNCLAESIGATHGLTESEVDTLIAKIPKHHENIAEQAAAGESACFDLPAQDSKELKALIKEHKGKWKDIVVLGSGGAVVGVDSLCNCLLPSRWTLDEKARKKSPRVLTLHNSDPQAVTDLAAVIDPKQTLFVVISRSGMTADTNALASWAIGLLRKKAGKTSPQRQLIMVTDPDHSPLADVARKYKATILPQPGNLADRFSVLGPGPLFVAGCCGIDTDEVLAGAAAMKDRCWQGDAWTNPAYMHALLHYLLTRKRRKTIHTTMAFDYRLRGITGWYDHLLTVSLGKMLNKKGKAVHVGPAPDSCLGPSGLHGDMQLYAEGPFDKVISFITVKDHGASVTVPKDVGGHEAIESLGGRELAEFVEASYLTAAETITSAGRPNCTFTLESITPQTIGGLYYMFQLSVIMSAELYGIDPFNQPGVDDLKQGMHAIFGRAGFEDRAKVLETYRKRPVKTC